MLCLASAHALVRLDDGTIVGDPMEKTALEALDWALISGDKVAPTHPQATAALELTIRRRFQFSSALKRMTNVSVPNHFGGRAFTSVKGAPGTTERLLASIPDVYDGTCKWLTRHSSRALALRLKEMDAINIK